MTCDTRQLDRPCRLLVMENSERHGEEVFSTGDTYSGDFKGLLPHGQGKYTWLGGTFYEGDWEKGKMTGKGKMLWPSGARYEGDISGGYLHGQGTLIGVDGSVYSGTWRMSIPHGVGTKKYPNSDVYQGAWKEGIQEGSGRYTWSNNGNAYTGNWKGGKMCGRGVMKWANGDIYDGFWLNGLRHGSGIYRFADGGFYFGIWSRDLKDGKGTFYTSGSDHPITLKKWSSMRNGDVEQNLLSCNVTLKKSQVMKSKPRLRIPIGTLMKNPNRTSYRSVSLDGQGSVSHLNKELSCSTVSTHENDEQQEKEKEKEKLSENLQEEESECNSVYEREYVQGVLISEKLRSNEAAAFPKKRRISGIIFGKEAKLMRWSSCIGGNPISNRSYYLMLNLQLGIRYTLGKTTPVPMREVRSSDFGKRARLRMYFPRKGSPFTPPHYSRNFYWKDYCPMVFRNLREMFKLDAAEYMMSICGVNGIREISSSGKSGSIFYLSHNDRFVIKTLIKSELRTLLKMLPSYYDHVCEQENTLITKFFGLHRIKTKRGRQVQFVVMGNMFCTELRIHKRFDLKGSTVGRFTTKEKMSENTTLKDLDLDYVFQMDKLLQESLFKQLSVDCKFLESQEIIDYSLLLGLHFRAPIHLKTLFDLSNGKHRESSSTIPRISADDEIMMIPSKSIILLTHEPRSVSTAPGPHIRGSTLKAFSVGDKEVDVLLPGTARLRVQLGVNMPAQANHRLLQEDTDTVDIEMFEVYDVVLYMGVIDILQHYNLKKKAENWYKSLQFDPQAISAVEPKLYAERFINFLKKVFPTANLEAQRSMQ